jgi:hypothetical protein
MSIRRYTVTRIDVDYYTVQEDELTPKLRVKRDHNGEFYYKDYMAWEFVCSYGGQWTEDCIPEEAKNRNPRTLLRKNEQSYTFYACVYHFPHPRLMGKFEDYTSAYGWEDA